MAALVMDGSYGVGAEISKALKANDFSVAATYDPGDVEAAVFSKETGVDIYEWSEEYARNRDALISKITDIEAETGVIKVAVACVGGRVDIPIRGMPPDQWSKAIEGKLDSVLKTLRPIIRSMHSQMVGRVVLIIPICEQGDRSADVGRVVSRIGEEVRLLAETSRTKGVAINAICLDHFESDIVMASLKGRGEMTLTTIFKVDPGVPEAIARLVADLVCARNYINGWVAAPGDGSFLARDVLDRFEDANK